MITASNWKRPRSFGNCFRLVTLTVDFDLMLLMSCCVVLFLYVLNVVCVLEEKLEEKVLGLGVCFSS